MSRRHRGRRNVWLDRLGDALVRLGSEDFPRALWASLFDLLREQGMAAQAASHVALRCCRLAMMLLQGTEQRHAACALSVSERTGKLDAQRLRTVVEGGALGVSPVAPLPRVPRRPGDRVTAPASRLGKRR